MVTMIFVILIYIKLNKILDIMERRNNNENKNDDKKEKE